MSKVKNYYWNETERFSDVIIDDYVKITLILILLKKSIRS